MATEEFKKTITNLWEDYLKLSAEMKSKGYDTTKYGWLQYKEDYLKFTTQVEASYNSDLEDFEYDDEEEDKEDE